MSRNIAVVAHNPRPTSTGVLNGIDVDVAVSLGDDPEQIEGEVTLVPSQSDGSLVTYGDALDHWMSGELVRRLSGYMSESELRAACREIAGEAIVIATEVAS